MSARVSKSLLAFLYVHCPALIKNVFINAGPCMYIHIYLDRCSAYNESRKEKNMYIYNPERKRYINHKQIISYVNNDFLSKISNHPWVMWGGGYMYQTQSRSTGRLSHVRRRIHVADTESQHRSLELAPKHALVLKLALVLRVAAPVAWVVPKHALVLN